MRVSDGDNDFWKFSLALYSMPGVADSCLILQERYELDVNVLLFCAWLGSSRRVLLSSSEIERIESEVSHWHNRVVRPLRSVRQYLKPIARDDVKQLRDLVKSHELESERIEQDLLFLYAESCWPSPAHSVSEPIASANLEEFLRVKGGLHQADERSILRLLSKAVGGDARAG